MESVSAGSIPRRSQKREIARPLPRPRGWMLKARLAEARDSASLAQAARLDVEGPAAHALGQRERRRRGDIGEVSVAHPVERQTRLVEDRLRHGVIDLATQTDRHLAVLVAHRHVVMELEHARPTADELLAHARRLDNLVRGAAVRRIVGHVGREVLPLVVLAVEHDEAAHLANVAVEPQHARVLVEHGAVAAGAGDDLDAGARELHEHRDEVERGLARRVFEHARARPHHGAVEIGEDVAHARIALAALLTGEVGQKHVGHGSSAGWCR